MIEDAIGFMKARITNLKDREEPLNDLERDYFDFFESCGEQEIQGGGHNYGN